VRELFTSGDEHKIHAYLLIEGVRFVDGIAQLAA
jgi:hypothetical protein